MILTKTKSSFTVFTAFIAVFAVVAAILTSFVILPSTAAKAVDCGVVPCSSGESIGVNISGSTGSGAGGSGGVGVPGGGSSGGGNGGGSVKPPQYLTKTFSCAWERGGGYPADSNSTCVTIIGYALAGTVNLSYPAKCAARNGNTPALSLTASFSVTDYRREGGAAYITLVSYTCHYPPYASPNTVKGTKMCFIQYDSALYYSRDKNAIRSGGSLAPVRAGSNRYNNIRIGVADYNNCTRTFNANQQYYPKVPQDGGYGFYRASANNVRAVTCQFIGFPAWTGNASRDRYTCGGQYNAGISGSSYAVYSCSTNFSNYGSNWAGMPTPSFSITACSNFSCTMSGPTLINGSSGNVEVMRNGENVNWLFPNANVSHDGGVRNIRNVQAKTDVIAGSSPYNSSVGVNADKQYFQLRASNGTSKANFGVWEDANASKNRNIGFYWSSDAGKNFRTDRVYRFTADFRVFVADTSAGGGSMQWQTDTVTYNSGSSCSTKSAPVSVVRSVNK